MSTGNTFIASTTSKTGFSMEARETSNMGRSSDPADVLDTDSPLARLDVFNGGTASHDWSLFVADLSGGGKHQLVSWSIELTTIPEPSSLFLSICTLPLLLRRR